GCRLVDGLGGGGPCRHDYLSPLSEQLCDEAGKTLVLPFRPSILDGEILSLDVAQLAQALAEWPDEIGLQGRRGVPEDPSPVPFPGEWRCEEANGENDREPDQPHAHLGGDGWRGV